MKYIDIVGEDKMIALKKISLGMINKFKRDKHSNDALTVNNSRILNLMYGNSSPKDKAGIQNLKSLATREIKQQEAAAKLRIDQKKLAIEKLKMQAYLEIEKAKILSDYKDHIHSLMRKGIKKIDPT